MNMTSLIEIRSSRENRFHWTLAFRRYGMGRRLVRHRCRSGGQPRRSRIPRSLVWNSAGYCLARAETWLARGCSSSPGRRQRSPAAISRPIDALVPGELWLRAVVRRAVPARSNGCSPRCDTRCPVSRCRQRLEAYPAPSDDPGMSRPRWRANAARTCRRKPASVRYCTLPASWNADTRCRSIVRTWWQRTTASLVCPVWPLGMATSPGYRTSLADIGQTVATPERWKAS